jgi:hypothetical protein
VSYTSIENTKITSQNVDLRGDTENMGIFSRIVHTVSGGDFRMSIKDPSQVDKNADRFTALVEASNHSEQPIVLSGEARYVLKAVYKDNDNDSSRSSSRSKEISKGPVTISDELITIEPGATIEYTAEIVFASGESVSDVLDEHTDQLPEFMQTAVRIAGKLGEMSSRPDYYDLSITVFLENGEKLEADSKRIRCGSGMGFSIG